MTCDKTNESSADILIHMTDTQTDRRTACLWCIYNHHTLQHQTETKINDKEVALKQRENREKYTRESGEY